jgi:amidase
MITDRLALFLADGYLYRTLNPHNINLSSGGSTGGEAALLAMRGSVMGIGTDIGGSIRGPSAFCGIWGYKPTSSILPTKGYIAGEFAGPMNISLATGPMAGSMRDCSLFVESILSQRPYLEDPTLKGYPWFIPEKDKPDTPLRVGVMLSDGLIQPQPPVVRALDWVQTELAKHSDRFTLVPFEYLDAQKGISLLREQGGYWPDAGVWVKKACAEAGEPLFPLTESVLCDAPTKPLTVTENLLFQQELTKFQYAIAESWNKQDVDVVLAPCFVGPASMHDTAHFWNYTCLWNVVDYPSVVIPTPIVTKAGEKYAKEYSRPLSADCNTVRQLWEAGDFEGAPINLQLIARKNHDIQLWSALQSLVEIL